MLLKDILEGLDYKGDVIQDLEIESVESDSRNVKKGSLFVAIEGFDYDGHEYITEAIKNGAALVIVDEKNIEQGLKISKPFIVTTNTRYALGICARNFYADPSKNFKLIGITGTKGKTTTSFMIKSMLEACDKKVGLIGTIGKFIGDTKIEDSNITTPESTKLQEIFCKMRDEKVEFVIMEVSSQSLKLDRVAGLEFDVGVFTNFSKDHISKKEHLNVEDYFNSKAKLFTMCKKAFINGDDIYSDKIKKISKCEVKTFGIDNICDIMAEDIEITNSCVTFKYKTEVVELAIPGRFSVYNALRCN